MQYQTFKYIIMKTTINFIEKKTDNFIFTIHDDAVDCFKVGQKIYLDVEEMYPRTISKIEHDEGVEIASMLEQTEKDLLEKLPKSTRFKIVSKHSFLTKSFNRDDTYHLNIEYFIKKSPKFYWKWWYIKYKLKSIFK